MATLKEYSLLAAFIALPLILLLLALGDGQTFLLQVPFYTIAGWIYFVQRVFPQVQVNQELLLFFVFGFMVLLFGVHRFMSFVYANYGAETNKGQAGRTWHFRWTAAGLLLFLAMFASGIAFVGAVHQTAWLATSAEPIAQVDRVTFERIQAQLENAKSSAAESVAAERGADPVQEQRVQE